MSDAAIGPTNLIDTTISMNQDLVKEYQKLYQSTNTSLKDKQTYSNCIVGVSLSIIILNAAKALSSTNEAIRVQAVKSVATKHKDNYPAIGLLSKVLSQDPSNTVRIEAVKAISVIGGRDAEQILVDNLRKQSAAVRKEIVNALKEVVETNDKALRDLR
ncbi:MAG: HEAT repeat domain-containing protein [Candidatus Saganbacteria bacterium]|nr:HEAT repeat domain-containing protein [Candidatus Saganbacteria bacterium]